MATSEELRENDFSAPVISLRIDGFPAMWVSDYATHCEGSQATSGTWAFQSTGSLPPVTASLSMKSGQALSFKLSLRNGELMDGPISLVLKDWDGQLARLMRSIDPDMTPLQPGNILPDDAVAAAYHGKQVGIEKIASNGDRHQYPAVLEFRPGFEHQGSHKLYDVTQVSNFPIVKDHRRFVLSLHEKDTVLYPITSSNPYSVRTPDEGIPLYWGEIETMGRISSDEIEIGCRGPRSWLKKTLARDLPEKPTIVRGMPKVDVELSANPFLSYGIAFVKADFGDMTRDPWMSDGPQNQMPYYQTGSLYGKRWAGVFTWDDPSDPSDDSYWDQLVDDINTLKDTAGSTPPDGGYLNGVTAWNDGYTELTINGDKSITIQNTRQAGEESLFDTNPFQISMLWITAHYSVWDKWGYDVFNQSKLPYDDPHYVQFLKTRGNFKNIGDEFEEGYYTAIFATTPKGYEAGYIPQDFKPPGQYLHYNNNTPLKLLSDDKFTDINNGGSPRTWKPLHGEKRRFYINDDISLEYPQHIDLPEAGDYYVKGQLTRPPIAASNLKENAYEINGVAVNTRGKWVFDGLRFSDSQEDPYEERQVFDCSWTRVLTTDQISNNNNLHPQIVAHDNIAPKRYGITTKGDQRKNKKGEPLSEAWGSSTEDGEEVQAMPLITWENSVPGYPKLIDMMIAMMTTTGNGVSWDYFEPRNQNPNSLPHFTVGYNNIGDIVSDKDHFYYGLQIPKSFIQPYEDWEKAVVGLADLKKCSIYTTKPVVADEILNPALQSRGLAWSLKNNKYGIFNFTKTPSLQDVDIAISSTDYSVKQTNERFVQEWRDGSAIDKVVFNYDFDPVDETFNRKREVKSLDPGVKYRTGKNVLEISDRTIVADMKVGGAQGVGELDYVSQKLCNFYFQPHYYLDIRVQKHIALNVNIGSVVSLTDPDVIDQNGEKGVTGYICRVVEYELFPMDGFEANLRLLIYADNAKGFAYYSPEARVLSVITGSTYTDLYVEKDRYDFGNDFNITSYFLPPSEYTATTGSTVIQAVQNSGRTGNYSIHSSFYTVTSASFDDGLIRINSVMSEHKRDSDMFIMFANIDQQTEDGWIDTIFAVHTDENGEHGGSAMKRWRDAP